MSETPDELDQPRILNFHRGNFEILDAPIVNVDVETMSGDDPLLVENSVVFIRSANVLRDMPDDDQESVIDCYSRVLAPEGKLHIYEPHATRELGGKLLRLLNNVGFTQIDTYPATDDFSAVVEANYVDYGDDSLRISARHKKAPHTHDALLDKSDFDEKCEAFRRTNPNKPAVSWVVAVYNEERNLPHFLAFLEASYNNTGMEREFIFVLNGCTDRSEEILTNFVNATELTASVTHSELGILPAFRKGIASRSLDGFVGRFDADIVLHPQTLDLLQMHLAENTAARVTYAEPLTLESETIFNTAAHHPEVMSKRLYYTGKTSLYRQDPYLEDGVADRPPQLVADDIFTSFNFIYHKGFKAISRAPHAVVYEKVIGNFEDLTKQTSRANSEIKRVFEAYPHFRILGDLTQQDVAPGAYHDLLKAADDNSFYVEEWSRLESTK